MTFFYLGAFAHAQWRELGRGGVGHARERGRGPRCRAGLRRGGSTNSGGRRQRAHRRRESTGSLGREKESSGGLVIEREREVTGGRRNGRPWRFQCHQWRRFNGEEVGGERERNDDNFLAWARARWLRRVQPVGSTSKRASVGMTRCGRAGQPGAKRMGVLPGGGIGR
jgi:hypothetical protein